MGRIYLESLSPLPDDALEEDAAPLLHVPIHGAQDPHLQDRTVQ